MDRLKQINKKLDKISKARDKAMKSFDFQESSYEDFEALHEPFTDEACPLLHERQQLTPTEWGDIPDYGDLFTMKEWTECVKTGGFIDYDGSGCYSDGKRMSNKSISPSDVRRGHILDDKEFTHVIWFNR